MPQTTVPSLRDIEWLEPVLPPGRNEAVEAVAKSVTGKVPKVLAYVAPSEWLSRAVVSIAYARYSHADPKMIAFTELVASHENACRYCYGLSHAVLRIQGRSETEIERLLHELELAELDDDTRATLEFVRALARSSPRPVRAQVDALVARGMKRQAVIEIAAFAAMMCFQNRVATFLAVPPEAHFESIPDSFFGRLMRPFVKRRLARRHASAPPPPAIGAVEGGFGGVVAALDGTPAAAIFRDTVASAFASPVLSRRAKSLMFGVVARNLGCQMCENEARTLLGAEGLDPSRVDEALDHLTSPALEPLESKLASYARDTVHYRPAQIQARTRAFVDEIGPARALEAVGVSALANAVVRLAMLRS